MVYYLGTESNLNLTNSTEYHLTQLRIKLIQCNCILKRGIGFVLMSILVSLHWAQIRCQAEIANSA